MHETHWRTITLVITYRDDPERPRILDLRAEADRIEQRLTKHLATDAFVHIERDEIVPHYRTRPL